MEVGILFTLFAIGDITLGPWIGRFADRTGRKRIAVAAGVPVALFGIALVAGLSVPRAIRDGLPGRSRAHRVLLVLGTRFSRWLCRRSAAAASSAW